MSEKISSLDLAGFGPIALAAIREAEDGAIKWGAANSAHEAFAVMKEEVDELWDHVKTKQSNRDLHAMQKEAIQVAAMAIRFAAEVCDERRGRR